MPSIEFTLSGVELQPNFVAEIHGLLSPYAEALSAESQASGYPREPSEFMQWSYWKITSGDGLQYANPHPFYGAPDPANFEGSRTATFMVGATSMSTNPEYAVALSMTGGWATCVVTAPKEEEVRGLSAAVSELFSGYATAQPEQPVRPFKVFIAYGGGPAWEIVRDYLKRADIEVDAFTEAERVGEVTIDVVSQMVHSASVAVIVMTAADELRDGTWHARQNVVHEAGFAQAAIGVRNTIILLEEGVAVPSNLANVTYIPFPRGAVHTTERRVVARVLETKADMDSKGGYAYGGGGFADQV